LPLWCSLDCPFYCPFGILWNVHFIVPSVFSNFILSSVPYVTSSSGFFILLPLWYSLDCPFYCPFGILWIVHFIAPSVFSGLSILLPLRYSLTFILSSVQSQKIGKPHKLKVFGSKSILEKTKGAIKNGQFIDTDNIDK
jgi:hypothetical protein